MGAFANVGLTLILVAIANTAIFSLGLGADDPAYLALWYSPPGWFVAIVWFTIYILWGLARWRVVQEGEKGAEVSWWVLYIIIDGLFFPIRTRNFDIYGSLFENAISLLLIIFVTWRVYRVSKRGAYLLMPSIAWTSFANFLGWAAVANGAKP